MFQDHGAVGRIPLLVPMKWENGWPVMGVDGRVPATLDLPAARPITETNLVASDDFSRKARRPPAALGMAVESQPRQRPSVARRPGWLRWTTGRVDADLLAARNTLTQRTFGPACLTTVSLDVSRLRDGDVAGLVALQKRYGLVGVKQTGDNTNVPRQWDWMGRPRIEWDGTGQISRGNRASATGGVRRSNFGLTPQTNRNLDWRAA